MTEAEQIIADAKAKAAAEGKPSKGKKTNTVSQKGIESSLAIVAETQYQNGVALTRKVGEQSFLKGIEDELETMLEAGDMDDFQLSAIAAKFQEKASKRLNDRTPLILPAAQWCAWEEQESEDEA